MKANPLPKREYLHEIFTYDPATGVLYWKVRLSIRVWPGKPAGRLNNRGYLRVGILGKCYLVHRIVYFMCKGIDPVDFQVDHEDGDRTNNRISNLRVADNSQNNCNTSNQRNNKSGFKGVCFHKNTGTFRGYVMLDRKQYSAGFHATPELAAEAVRTLRKSLHKDFCNHGD